MRILGHFIDSAVVANAMSDVNGEYKLSGVRRLFISFIINVQLTITH